MTSSHALHDGKQARPLARAKTAMADQRLFQLREGTDDVPGVIDLISSNAAALSSASHDVVP
jgi:hypothetical protein